MSAFKKDLKKRNSGQIRCWGENLENIEIKDYENHEC